MKDLEGTAAARRVGLVIGQLTVGGAEKQLAELLRGLDRGRFRPYVYSLSDAASTVRAFLKTLDVPVRPVAEKGLLRARRLAAALAADGIEITHSWLFIANTYAWAARWLGWRGPLVTSARNCKSQGWLHHAANAAAFRASSRILVNSARVRDYIVERYGAARNRIAVVHNGVDTERFRPAASTPDAPPTVFGVGRLVTQKNPLLFVEAAARVHAEEPTVRFRWAGDGPLRETVADLARAQGLGDVFELLGERGDVDEILRGAHALWLTSSWEGLPNVVLEAMASGLPVVASDVGGASELVQSGCEGFLARPYHTEDFVHYGLSLIRDPRLRGTMGTAARRRARQFSLRRMVLSTEAIYEVALARGTT